MSKTSSLSEIMAWGASFAVALPLVAGLARPSHGPSATTPCLRTPASFRSLNRPRRAVFAGGVVTRGHRHHTNLRPPAATGADRVGFARPTRTGVEPAGRFGESAREDPSDAQRSPNLVPNGDFEAGSGRPERWQRPDGLTSFWEKTPADSGRLVRLDTDVLVSQFRERRKQIRDAEGVGSEPPPPPRRIPTRAPKYDTVAGNDGVHFSSEDIPIHPGKFYKLQVDVRVEGEASPKVWVKGYARVKSRGGTRRREIWKKSLNCSGANREWATYTMVFPRNTRFPAGVDRVRVQLYAYWPPATYFFDNVRLVEIEEREAVHYDRERDLRRPRAKHSKSPAKRRRGS